MPSTKHCLARLALAALSLAPAAGQAPAQVASCGSCTLWLSGTPSVDATLSVQGACADDCSGSLDLESQGIVHIANGTFAGMPALRDLYLYSNAIAAVHQDTFKYNTALEILDLDGNAIAAVHQDTFKYNSALQRLFLDRKAIAAVHKYTYKYKSEVRGGGLVW